MTCTQFKRELKCKFPPCPCQKCAKLRGANSNHSNNSNNNHKHNDGGGNGNGNGGFSPRCRDTPPERPIPKYQFQSKCAGKLQPIGPKYQRKYPSQACCSGAEAQKKCEEGDDCYTGKGCCNTGRNFITFMINIIGYMAFLIIAMVIFWLMVCHWAVVLGFKVYKSDRKTQVAVVSVISFIFLLIFCSAALKAIRKGSTQQRAAGKPPAVHAASAPPPPPKAVKTEVVKEVVVKKTSSKPAQQSTSMLSFSWRQSAPKQPQLDRGDGDSASCDPWDSYLTCREKAKQAAKQQAARARSSWVPTFGGWGGQRTSTKEIEKPARSYWIRSSWMPWSKEGSTKGSVETKKTESRTSWLSWRTATPAAAVTTTTTIEKRSSWLPSFKWGQGAKKEVVKKTETRTYWLSASGKQTPTKAEQGWLAWLTSWWPSWLKWHKEVTVTAKVESDEGWLAWLSSWCRSWCPEWLKWGKKETVQTKAETDDGWLAWLSSWCPSWCPSWLKWGKKEIVQTQTKVEVKTTSWTTYLTWRKQAPPPAPPPPPVRSTWTTYLSWSRTTPVVSQKPAERTSWLSFKWGQKKDDDTKPKESEKRSSWFPSSFSWSSSTTTNSNAVQPRPPKSNVSSSSSWLPSFITGKKPSCKSGCTAKSACAMRQHKVTVSIDDEEARQIYKKSKLYAIPTEMKHPPKVVIYLRDMFHRSE